MLASYHRAMKQPRRVPPQEFVIACVSCGEVVGLKMGGERVPSAIHICPEQHHDVNQEDTHGKD